MPALVKTKVFTEGANSLPPHQASCLSRRCTERGRLRAISYRSITIAAESHPVNVRALLAACGIGGVRLEIILEEDCHPCGSNIHGMLLIRGGVVRQMVE